MKSIINENISATEEKEIKDSIKKELKKTMSDLIEKEIEKQMKKNVNEKQVKEIVANSLVKLFNILWNRSSFWSKNL